MLHLKPLPHLSFSLTHTLFPLLLFLYHRSRISGVFIQRRRLFGILDFGCVLLLAGSVCVCVVMSYSNSNPENDSSSASTNSPELKLYQAFIFSVPICFTFIILFLFYLIYLRRGSSDLSSLGMRTTFIPGNSLSTAEIGLSKELREMLPIVVFKESFTVMDSQCSVCLGDYQADDKLQQIPVCKHTFHMDCIDLWLTSHTTCPLCRLALLPSQSHQSQEDPVPSLVSPDEGLLSQPESQPVNHINDGQEQHPTECDRDGEGYKETEEDERNSIGPSNACCSCRPG